MTRTSKKMLYHTNTYITVSLGIIGCLMAIPLGVFVHYITPDMFYMRFPNHSSPFELVSSAVFIAFILLNITTCVYVFNMVETKLDEDKINQW